jgi:hypothetical protein
VRFTGSEATARNRNQAFLALRDATQAAGVALRDVTSEPDAAENANLEFRIVWDHDLKGDQACVTRLQRWRRWLLEKVLVEARATSVWRCAHHEAMHVMGIRGHPYGKTVLSYFRQQNDALLPMDLLMLKAWYSPRMRPGATPFEALVVLTDAVVEATVDEGGHAQARAAQALFLRDTVREMARYAKGEGEPPKIVFRSGRGNAEAMKAGQNDMAYFLGVAHLRGFGIGVDREQALRWLEQAAGNGHARAKTMLDGAGREVEQ